MVYPRNPFPKLLPVAGALAAVAASNSAALASAYTEAVIADGASHFYQLNETSGTVATDSAGGDNGVYTGTMNLGQPGAAVGLGSSAGFTGSGEVIVPNPRAPFGPFNLSAGTPFTIELWYRALSPNRGDLFTLKGGGDDFGIHSQSQGRDTLSYYHNGNPWFFEPVAQGSWNYVVATRESTGLITLYDNGIAVNTSFDSQPLSGINGLFIGSNNDGSPNPALQFFGDIQDVAFYSGTALTATEVANHYADASVVPEPGTWAAGGVLLAFAGILKRRRP